MDCTTIVRVNSIIDDNNFVFASSPFMTQSGAAMVSFTYDNHPLYLQTPIVTCPVGFRVFERNNKNHKLMLTPTPDMVQFIQHIDGIVIDNIMKNSQEWFGKKFQSKEILQALFYPSLKMSDKYPPSMNIRLRFDNETLLPTFTVFDTQRNEITFDKSSGPEQLIEILHRKCQVRLIIGHASIWGISGRYGYGWDCVQIQLCNNPTLLTNVKHCLFNDDEEKENNDT